jgi:hypothetical protein
MTITTTDNRSINDRWMEAIAPAAKAMWDLLPQPKGRVGDDIMPGVFFNTILEAVVKEAGQHGLSSLTIAEELVEHAAELVGGEDVVEIAEEVQERLAADEEDEEDIA